MAKKIPTSFMDPQCNLDFFLMAMISLKKCDFLDCSLQQTFGVVSTFCAVVKVIYPKYYYKNSNRSCTILLLGSTENLCFEIYFFGSKY